MRRRVRAVWKKRTKEDQSHHEEIKKDENLEFRSYFVSYVDGEAIYNIKYGDSIRQIPPITGTLDSIISLSKGYSVGQSSTVDDIQPQLVLSLYVYLGIQNVKMYFILGTSYPS